MKIRILAILASAVILTACGREEQNNNLPFDPSLNTVSFDAMSRTELEMYVDFGLMFGALGTASADVPDDPSVNPDAIVHPCATYSSTGTATSGSSRVTLLNCSDTVYSHSAELVSTWNIGDVNTFGLTGYMSFSIDDPDIGTVSYDLLDIDIYVTENTSNSTGTLDMNYVFMFEGAGVRFAFSVETRDTIVVDGYMAQSGTLVMTDGSSTITVTYDPEGYTYTVS